ncbi:H-N-H homing endonuclease [Salmonella phage Stp1]|uniref:H-N-H homing endonuclease n=1 Tax=Salmonella phage Stp1 TaxID=1971233 RepID=A0A240FFW0_9CAUD|nr:H-N-H homing endonuclease [Salmonella phage Stp1]
MQNISNRGYKLRANGLPTNIYYDKKRPRDSLGRDYLRAQITNPITKKKVSKCGYDLDTLLLWLEQKREEFKKSIN